MNTTDIKVMGKEWKVGFDFAVTLQYEEDHGKIMEFQDMKAKTQQMRLAYSVLKTFNASFSMTLQEFLHTITPEDFLTLTEAIASHVIVFYHLPELAEKHVIRNEEDEGKNPNP